MDNMDELLLFLENFFKLNVLGKKGFFSKKRQNGSSNHIPLRRRGLSCLEEQLPWGKRD
jgi:hypothetical protein